MTFSTIPMSNNFGETLDQLIANNYSDLYYPQFQKFRQENSQLLLPYSVQIIPHNPNFIIENPLLYTPITINVAQLDQQILCERNFTLENHSNNHFSAVASEQIRNHDFLLETNFTSQDYVQYQQNKQLMSAGSPIIAALGLKNYDLGFINGFVDTFSLNSLEDFKQKTAQVCHQIEQNKVFWSSTFENFLRVDPHTFELSWEASTKMYTDREYLTGDGYSEEEQVEMALNRFQDIQVEANQIKNENDSYPFLTKLTNSESPTLETVPFAENQQENQKGFEQALSDFDQLLAYNQNRTNWTEECSESFPENYLESRINGAPNNMGGNFAYFSGCLIKTIDHIVQKDPSATFGIINTKSGLNKTLDSIPTNPYNSALQIFELSALRAGKIKEAFENGVSTSDIYTSTLNSLVFIGKTGNYSRGLSLLDSSLNTKIYDAFCSDIPQEIQQFNSEQNSLAQNPFLVKAKTVGSKICHVFLKEIEICASYFTPDNNRICFELKSLFSNLVPDSVFDAIGASDYESQLKASMAIHSRIDKFFSTNFAQQYSGSSFHNDMALAIVPRPSDIFGRFRMPRTFLHNEIGWRAGQNIRNATIRGNCPKWNTVRQRHWKNKALLHENGEILTEQKYEVNPANIARMKKGLAPQIYNYDTMQLESIELHHIPPQRNGGLFEFLEVTREEHAGLDPNRFI